MLSIAVGKRRGHGPVEVALVATTASVATLVAAVLANDSRRARLRDAANRRGAATKGLFGKALRDGRNRTLGAVAEVRGAFETKEVSDEKLVARVRARLGRLVTHPHAIEVAAHDGCVVLTGPVLEREVKRLVRAVRRVRGVRKVDNRLDVEVRAQQTPSLQGRGTNPRAPEIFQEHWTPSLRVTAGALGLGAIACGALIAPRFARVPLAGTGALLLARAVFDEPLSRAFGFGGKRRAVDFQKTITIMAPVDEVFAYWAYFETFPSFMDHVESVRKTGERTSNWRVRGPLRAPIEWDAEITRYVPNEVIAWKTIGKPLVKHAGIVRFESVHDGRATRIGVRMTYNPGVGQVGHAIASMLGVDPKRSLDEDLLRLKSLLEEGKATAHGREATPETVGSMVASQPPTLR